MVTPAINLIPVQVFEGDSDASPIPCSVHQQDFVPLCNLVTAYVESVCMAGFAANEVSLSHAIAAVGYLRMLQHIGEHPHAPIRPWPSPASPLSLRCPYLPTKQCATVNDAQF
jgi:hypothetical protein